LAIPAAGSSAARDHLRHLHGLFGNPASCLHTHGTDGQLGFALHGAE
jgi:hypothetical protein